MKKAFGSCFRVVPVFIMAATAFLGNATAQPATATFVAADTTTQGSWMGTYGGNGYGVIGDTTVYPNYVTVTPSGQSNYVWAGSTTDIRALQTASGRIAATWYSNSSFSVDLNFSDGAQHQLAVYCLDWDGNGARSEALTISDATTNAVLDTRNISGFQNGQYLLWNLSGHVLLTVTHTGGDNAVISGLFFDLPYVATSTFSPTGGTYAIPQTVAISTTTSGASIRYTTDGSTPSETAGVLYSGPVTVGSSEPIKAIAFASGLRDSAVATANYTIAAPATNAALFLASDASTQGNWIGAYGANGFNVIGDTANYPAYVAATPFSQSNWVWAASTTDVRALQTASSSGRTAATWYSNTSFGVDLIFTDGAQHRLAVYCVDWDGNGARAETLTISDGATGAVLDTRNISSFQNGLYLVWNLSGHVVLTGTHAAGDNAVISGLFFDVPSAALTTFSPGPGTYAAPTTVTLSSVTPGASIRYTTDGSTPSETVGTLYSGTIAVSSTTTIKAMAYAAGLTDSAVATANFTIAAPASNTALFVGSDASTQGNWIGTYGANGFNVIGSSANYPGYVAAAPFSQSNWVWAASTTDVRALQTASGSGRIAATWYSNASFGVDLIFTDGAQHLLAVYCVDWDGNGARAETLTISDGATGAVLDTRNISSFQNGLYLVWNLSGHVVLNVTHTGGDNGVVSGLFFDSPIVATPTFNPPSATYLTTQTVTINTTTSGASIRYTIDGSTPSETVGTLYSGPVSVNSSETIKAIAYKAGLMDSSVASAAYTISLPAATPTFGPAGGTYTYSPRVAIRTATSGASIRYTTDGSTPSNTAGTLYSSAITISTTTTLKAVAFATGYANSVVASAVYTIAAPPSVTTLTPTSGLAGTQITISGSGFGTTQGSGRLWLGSTLASVVTWTDTQIVGTVPAGSATGTAQVFQNGTWSSSVPFTVVTATISSVTPTGGLPGTQVAVTGSGFGAAQGNGQVLLGTAAGVVQSWSDSQVVALVGSGATSGNARVLQNGVWSNTVPFTVSIPHITTVSPASGSAGTSVTISGSGLGATQGSGTILLGSMNGSVVSWSDTQVVAAVATGSVTGVVKIQQNGIWSNALSFKVPTTGGTSLTLVPSSVSLVVGDTRTLQALSSTGQPVTGLTWNSSDTTVVSLSTDDPPILNALAVGHITITAGAASADVTVFPAGVLPVGTVTWSNPGDGSGVSQILPAVPSTTGVADVFALQNDGTVEAITSDGTVAWSYNIPDALLNTPLQPPWSLVTIIPDFQGGIIVVDYAGNGGPGSIQRVDGITGQPYPAYNFDANATLGTTSLPLPPPVVHTDGTIFAIQSEQTGEWRGSVVGIDPATGAQKFKVPVPIPQPDFYCGYSGTSYDASLAGATGLPNIVAGDGNYYFAYAYKEYSNCLSGPTHLRLLQVNSSGASQLLTILDADPPTPFGSSSVDLNLGLISNADVGVVLTWSLTFSGNRDPLSTQFGMAITTGASVNVVSGPSVPGQQTSHADDGTATGLFPVVPILQREDGSFIGSVLFNGTNSQQINMVAFDGSGNVLWEVPNEQPMIATEDGGVIGQSGVAYDQNGNATGQFNATTVSWLGNTYQIGSVEQILQNAIRVAKSWWPFGGGNPSGNGTAVQQPWFAPLKSCPGAATPCPQEAIMSALGFLRTLVQSPCSACEVQVFDKLPGTSQTAFSSFLSRPPRFWDGTRSYAPASVGFCPAGLLSHITCSFGSETVSNYLQRTTSDAASQTPADTGKGMQVFFNPGASICNVLSVPNPQSGDQGVLNQAILFHEGLHGQTGKDDIYLETSFRVSPPSANVTYYLEGHVIFGAGASACGN